jgi:ATP-dependent DNA helicase PIF1
LYLNYKKAKILKNTKLIIWDEAPMVSIHALNVIDSLLQNIMNNQIAFGGKAIVLGGDFRQVAPVLQHANRAQIVENSIKNGRIWNEFHIFYLKKICEQAKANFSFLNIF